MLEKRLPKKSMIGDGEDEEYDWTDWSAHYTGACQLVVLGAVVEESVGFDTPIKITYSGLGTGEWCMTNNPQNVNFALKASLVRDMLDVKDIDYETASSKKELKIVDIFDRAKKFTVLVEYFQ